jgi:serine/threonine protein kinase
MQSITELVEYEKYKDLPFKTDTDDYPLIAPNIVRVKGACSPWENEKAVMKAVKIDKTATMPLKDAKVTCQREARIMQAARHVHAIRVLTTFLYAPESESTLDFCIIMDHAGNGDLSMYLNKDNLQERWIGCLIRIVAHVHRLGIRHRDIKPKNVLVNGTEILLADFGASHMSLGKTVPTTMPQWSKIRTPSHCAPEVNEEEGRTRGRSADIFSLGAVILEMLLSRSGYRADFKDLQERTSYLPPRAKEPTQSFARTLAEVHSLLDDFENGSRHPAASWHLEVFKLCRDMMDRDRDRRPLADKVECRWTGLAQRAGGLSCDICVAGVFDKSKESRLVEACKNKQAKEVQRLLLEEGADPNTPGAIHQAAVVGDEFIICILLENQADVNVQDYAGQTALHYTAANGHVAETNCLLGRKGVAVGAIDLEGQTPLHCAATNGSVAIIGKLLDKGAVISVTDTDGRTPLHYAARQNHLEAVKFLLRKGADKDVSDKMSSTALHYARDKKYVDLIRVLEKWDPNEPGE